MNKRIKVVTVEYETKDHVMWKAGVLAYSIDEAIKTIVDNVPKYDRLVSTGLTREIDIISKNVHNDFFEMGNKTKNVNKKEIVNKEKDVVLEKSVGEKDTETLNDEVPCPFCDKTYKTKKTLSNHIKKYH